MKMPLAQDELRRYAQQMKLAELGIEGQLKLKNARVLCVGAGGLGSSLLLYLAAAGIGTIGIVDDDQVDISNLQRQVLYREENVGKKKAIIAKDQLIALNPCVAIHTETERLTLANAASLFSQYDIIADCTDNFASRYLINDVCYDLNKPLVFASISRFEGQCGFLLGKQSPCFRCLYPVMPDVDHFVNCNAGGVLGTLPGIVGMIQATEIIKWIATIGESLAGKLLTIDMLHMHFQTYHLSHHPDCALCIQQQSAVFNNAAAYACQLDDRSITTEELQRRLAANVPLFLLDVRSAEEHANYNIGGVNIPLPELAARLSELPPATHITIYCQSGKRSHQAATLLINNAILSVSHLAQGIERWPRAFI
jgi:adenylyltransferase/sulfurtransferase